MQNISTTQLIGFAISGLCFVSAIFLYFMQVRKTGRWITMMALVGLGLIVAGSAGDDSGWPPWHVVTGVGLLVNGICLVLWYRESRRGDHSTVR